MIEIESKIVSLDIFEVFFACDYEKCKGICCVEGDSGAPLEQGESEKLREFLPNIEHMLSDRAKEVIRTQGVSYIDEEGDEVTSIVDGKDCVFTTYDEAGNCLCAYEAAYRAGYIDWIKPLSCQLYPIRLERYKDFVAVNYHKWDVCKCALKRGKTEGAPLYQFLRAPLIRAFGEEWYTQLEEVATLLKEEKETQDNN